MSLQLALSTEIQNSLGFWISTSWIPDSRYLIPFFFSGAWTLDSNP